MPVDRATKQAWLIWSTAVLVYIAALFHRTSLGVASLEAGDRFAVGPAALGTFTVLQIGLYALMQIPTGLLVDRFGPRRVLTAAALLMGLAIAGMHYTGMAAMRVHAEMQYDLTLVIASIVIAISSPACSVKSSGGMMPVPVSRMAPCGKLISR